MPNITAKIEELKTKFVQVFSERTKTEAEAVAKLEQLKMISQQLEDEGYVIHQPIQPPDFQKEKSEMPQSLHAIGMCKAVQYSYRTTYDQIQSERVTEGQKLFSNLP
ncbi:hypothetical protein [Edwardsiella tarda]|uniref:hypothetical protein n=1 Tax=Edwardsiella tarda TaxID=636 RepID=UPI00351C18F8